MSMNCLAYELYWNILSRNINPVVTQQVALDNALVAPAKRLKIERCNARIEFRKPQREETYHVTLDALKLSPCYPAFLITAEICPRLPNQEFVDSPSKDALVSFIKKLDYSGKCDMLILPRKQGSLRKLLHPQENFGVVIRDTHGVSVSKKKAPAKVTKDKGIDLLSDVVLLKDAQLKKALKKSKQDSRMLQLSGSNEGTDTQPGVPNVPTYESESDNESWGDSQDDEGNDGDSDDDNDGDDSKNDDDRNSDADDSERTDSDSDEEVNPNLNLKDDEEEETQEDEYDVNITPKDTEPENEGKGDAEMTDAGLEDQSSSVSSDFASKFLNLDNVPPTDSEVASLMNIKTHQEDSSTQAPPLLTVPITAILETSFVPLITVHPTIQPISPILQQTTPTPTPTTEPTTSSILALLDFSFLFRFDQRVLALEMEISQFKRDDDSKNDDDGDSNADDSERTNSDSNEEPKKEGKGDAGITNDGLKDISQEKTYKQVIDDEHVTLTSTQKSDGSKQSSSVSSDFASKFLNLDNVPPADNEVASLMNVKTHQEDSSTQATSFLTPISPIPQQTTPTPTPTTEPTTSSIPTLLDFSFLFGFNQRVSALEMEISQFKQVDHSAQLLTIIKQKILAIVDDLLSTIIGFAIQMALQSYTAEFEKKAHEEKDRYITVIAKSIKGIIKDNQESPSNLAKETSFTEFELQMILLDKLEKGKSYRAAKQHRDLYDALVKSYQLENDLFDSYGKAYSLKRGLEDKDKDEDPPARSDQGLKNQKTSKDAKPSRGSNLLSKATKHDWFKKPERHPTPDPDWNKRQHVDFRPHQTWISQVVRAEEPPTSFDELMHTPIDFFAFILNRHNITDLTQAILVGLAFNLLKGTWKSCRQVVPADYFINNDLEYLKGRSLSRKYMTSTTKIRAAKYDNIERIKDMVAMLWSPVKVADDIK
ncbi:hypothetical protein Tco_1313580 [Tanacetum coccineum]